MTPDLEKRVALQRIIRDGERMLQTVRETGSPYLAYLLEHVLHEARAMLIGAGHEMPPDEMSSHETPPSSPSVVTLVPRKPR